MGTEPMSGASVFHRLLSASSWKGNMDGARPTVVRIPPIAKWVMPLRQDGCALEVRVVFPVLSGTVSISLLLVAARR